MGRPGGEAGGAGRGVVAAGAEPASAAAAPAPAAPRTWGMNSQMVDRESAK